MSAHCDRCNYDTHVCPGCGKPLRHGVEVCTECLAETAPHKPPPSPLGGSTRNAGTKENHVSTSTDPNAWLMGGSVPSAKFETHGDTVTGVITDTPEVRPQTDFDSGQPLFWDDGKPKMQLVVTLATDQRDPGNADDDGTRRVYVKGKLQQAVAQAVRKAGAKGLEVGGTLTVTYVGDDEPKRKGMSGAKLYTAEYTAAASAFLATGELPAPAAPTAAPSVPPTAPQSNPAAAAALANLTPEQIQALLAQQPHSQQQPANAPF
jgi:hypothetical protein